MIPSDSHLQRSTPDPGNSFPSPREYNVFSELNALTAAFVLMALSVAADHGHFSWKAIILLILSTGCLLFAATRRLKPRITASFSNEKVLAAALVLLLLVGIFDAPGYYLHSKLYTPVYIAVQIALAVLVSARCLWSKSSLQNAPWLFFGACVAGFGLRIWMVTASPVPVIDVFNQFQESSAHLLQGLNPFRTPVTDPLEGIKNFGYHVTGYAYPPANLYAHVASYFSFGDIRYGYIAFEFVAMLCLYALTAETAKSTGQLLVLLFLFHPRGLFVIEQAWTEPLLVGSGALFLWLAAKRPHSRWIPVAFGFFLSLKQYLVFFAALFFALPKRWRLILPVSAVILLTWLPFLLWDFDSAIQNGLLFQFRTTFRTDGLTLSTVFHRWFGWESTKWVAISVGLGVTAWTWKKFQGRGLGGYLYASLLTTLSAFLVGSQAFCNYYYFLGAMILFLLAVRAREESAHAG